MATTSTTTIENIPENTSSIPTPPRTKAASHRLLYRGGLILPDSEILLDGLTFVMKVDYKSPISLISSPIPLGLESMRGRPLRLISIMDITKVDIECFGDVSLYLHPEAFLTRSFFERMLLQSTFMKESPDWRTSVAVRIGMGDGEGPDDSDILVFGQLPSPHSSLQQLPTTLLLLAGRIAPAHEPPEPLGRALRPDDPLPRPHPLANLSPGRRGLKRKRTLSSNSSTTTLPSNKTGLAATAMMEALTEARAQEELKRKKGKIVVSDPDQKAIRKRPALFRVPSLKKGTEGQHTLDDDGFLVPGMPVRALPTKPGMKGKSTQESAEAVKVKSEMEVKNKTAIKKRSVIALESNGITKTHEYFRDLYSSVHHGVAFAVRNVIAIQDVDRELISRLVDCHLQMYLDGKGGSTTPIDSNPDDKFSVTSSAKEGHM